MWLMLRIIRIILRRYRELRIMSVKILVKIKLKANISYPDELGSP
jgi:hypothetical protein